MESATGGEIKIVQDVPANVIKEYSVYSKETAEAMAKACAKTYWANIGIGVTGTFGNVDPANAEASHPGTVYYAIYINGKITSVALENIPPQKTRLDYKLKVANFICENLLALLT